MACVHYFLVSIVLSAITFSCAAEANGTAAEVGKGGKGNCIHLNNVFIISHNLFIQCVMRGHSHSMISYCYRCVMEYHNMNGNYTAFVNGYDGADNSTSCRSMYFDVNQLNIVDTVYNHALRLWDVAFCKGEPNCLDLTRKHAIDCFNPNCTWDKYDENCTQSQVTIDFEKAYNDTVSCIDGHKRSHMDNIACTLCLTQYNSLNRQYDEIRLKKADKFCFDIKNMMNQTRITWSETLHCCQDRTLDLLGFWVATASAISVAIVFYCSAFVYTRRRERVQYIPNDLMPYDRSNEMAGSQNALGELDDSTEPGPSTSYSPNIKDRQFDHEKVDNTRSLAEDDDNISARSAERLISVDH